jgi:hypothetical protein
MAEFDWDEWLDFLAAAHEHIPRSLLGMFETVNKTHPFKTNKTPYDLASCLRLIYSPDLDLSKWLFDRLPRSPVSIWRNYHLMNERGAVLSIALDSNNKHPFSHFTFNNRTLESYMARYASKRQYNKVAVLFGKPGRKRTPNRVTKFLDHDGDHACLTRVVGFLVTSEIE